MFLLLAAALAADRIEGSETLATGSTSVAHPWANGAITANPAALAIQERYHFAAGLGYLDRGTQWNLSAADSRTAEGVAFGVAFSSERYSPPVQTWELPGWRTPDQQITNLKRSQNVTASLAVPMFERKLSLGIQGAVSFFNHERQGKGRSGNGGAGLAWRPNEQVVIGVAGRNLLPLDDPNRDRPLEVLGGAWIGDPTIGALTLEGGARPLRPDVLVLGAGGEARVTEGFALRGGWRLEDAVHRLTAGFGAGTQRAGLDIGIAAPTTSLLRPVDWTAQLSFRFEGPDFDAMRGE